MNTLFPSDCGATVVPVRSESGHSGMVAFLAILLILLFVAFRAHGNGLGGDCGSYGGRGVADPANLWAVSGLAQSVPGFQAQNFTQQAVNFGETISTINQGNWSLSKQISDQASAAEIGALRDQLYEARAKLLQQETIKAFDEKFCATNATIADVRCNMLTAPRPVAHVGLPPLGCTNASLGHGGFNLGASPCRG